ncbi:MAG: YfiR family protein [Desulfobacterales bacterium]|nr:YfiR family protein [Desulfobacterales bacterium]
MKKILIIIAIIAAYPFAAMAGDDEYRVKGVLIEKIAYFITWPDEGDTEDPFVLAVLGGDPFKGNLDRQYKNRGRRIKNRSVHVVYIDDPGDVPETCHILFITYNISNLIGRIVERLDRRPVLMIGEYEGSARKGVHVNFYYTRKNTLHFEINVDALLKSGLKINPKLIEVAKVIRE